MQTECTKVEQQLISSFYVSSRPPATQALIKNGSLSPNVPAALQLNVERGHNLCVGAADKTQRRVIWKASLLTGLSLHADDQPAHSALLRRSRSLFPNRAEQSHVSKLLLFSRTCLNLTGVPLICWRKRSSTCWRLCLSVLQEGGHRNDLVSPPDPADYFHLFCILTFALLLKTKCTP